MDDIAPDVDFDAETKAFEEGNPSPEEQVEVVEQKVEAPPAQSAPAPAAKEVPLSALLEERREWKEKYSNLEKQLQEQSETFKRGNERLEKLAQVLQGKTDTAPPQFEQDPLGNLKYGADTALNEVQSLKAWKEKFEQEQQQARQFDSFRMAVNEREQSFAKEHPDYWQAAEHVVKTQREQLELLGVPGDQINTILAQQLSGFAATALRSGKNPAEVTYELAKRQGFRAGQKQQDIATLAKGVEAAKSVPSGGKEDATLSLEALSQMSDEDFDKLVDDPKTWGKIGRAA